jgi:hypothetical protein
MHDLTDDDRARLEAARLRAEALGDAARAATRAWIDAQVKAAAISEIADGGFQGSVEGGRLSATGADRDEVREKLANLLHREEERDVSIQCYELTGLRKLAQQSSGDQGLREELKEAQDWSRRHKADAETFRARTCDFEEAVGELLRYRRSLSDGNDHYLPDTIEVRASLKALAALTDSTDDQQED